MATQRLKIDFDPEALKAMYKKAEDRIQAILDSDDDDAATSDRKAKMAQFVASRLGKEIWSERIEATGADGESLLSAEEVAIRIANLKSKTKE